MKTNSKTPLTNLPQIILFRKNATLLWKIVLSLTLFIILFSGDVNAQISLTATTGTTSGTYTTLKTAFDAINAGTHRGDITLQITGSTIETASAVLNASGSSSANYTSIHIYPTVTGLSISGNIAAPLIDLNGADNITIDGRVNADGSTKNIIITNTSTSGNSATSTIRLYNGANTNTIQYCTIKGSSTDGSAGIIFISATSASTGNLIDNNNITNSANADRPVNAIYSGGAANTVTISNNNIYDFLNFGSSSNGVNLNSNTGASTITGNSFYETTTFAPTGGGYYYPIYINTNVAGFTISGNYIGGNAANCTGTWTKTNSATNPFFAIYVNSVGTGTPSIIKGNTINGFNWSNSWDHYWMGGISLGEGDYTLGVSGEPNTIGSLSGTPNMTFNFDGSGSIVIPILLNGSGYISCQYNNIGGITCNNTNSTEVTRFWCINRSNSNAVGIISNNTIGSATNPISCTSPSTGDWQWIVGIENRGPAATGLTISNNTISYLNNSNTINGYVSGIYSYDVGNAPLTISGNSIHDLTIANTNGGSGRDASVRGGIWVSSGNLVNVTNNTIYNLSNTNQSFNGYMYGIYCTGSSGANDCSDNTIYNLSATGTGAGPLIYGIYFNAYKGEENTINRNYIYGFTSAGVNTNCSYTKYYGIVKQNSCVAAIGNNIVSLGGNTISTIYGIYEDGGSGCNSSIYFNTVYLKGTPTTGNLPSYGLYSANNNTRTFKNNILFNARSNDGEATGSHYAMYIGNTTATITCDYNDYYATGISAVLGYFGTNKTLPIVDGQDAHSLNTNPSFTGAGGTSVNNYQPGVALNGTTISGYSTDYSGYSRAVTNTMGAIVQDNPLPVEITSFIATATNQIVTLNWSTATEMNNYGFEVERKFTNDRSTIGNWKKIGFVEGHGTSTVPLSYNFRDPLVQANTAYRLKQIDCDGNFEYSKEVEAMVSIPTAFTLSQNYPNPFNPTTVIGYSIASASHVTLKVFDLLGREVTALVNEQKEPGNYTAMFDGSRLSSGVYFYRLDAGIFSDVKRLNMMK